jgi:hypothetical protein
MSQTSLKLGSHKLWGCKYVAHNKGRLYQQKPDEEVVTHVMKQQKYFHLFYKDKQSIFQPP